MRYDHFSMLPEQAFSPRNGRFGGGMTLEGGKGGGSAPAPDPNIGVAQRELAELSKEQWSTFVNEMWPTMKAQVERQEGRADEQFALDRQIQDKQMAIADEEYARRRDVFRPVEDRQIADAMRAGSEEDQERQAGIALGDVRAATDRGARDAEMRMQSFGIDPTSGRYQGQMRAMDTNNAMIEAFAANKARTAAEQLGWAKRMDALALGAGQFGNQATSTGLALNAGGAAMNAGQNSVGNAFGMSGAYNSAAGTAMQGWNSVGTLGVNKYNADVNAYRAQQAAEGQGASGFGSLLGSIGAAAITKYSDRRVKDNIERIGTYAPLNIGIYSFEYKEEFKNKMGHGQRVGFMADEVESVIPHAVTQDANGYKMVNYAMVLE
jgi:hypothetical protein